MAIFEVTDTEIRAIPQTNFAKEGLKERADLQRLLQRSIEHISPDTMVLAEEFASWDESLSHAATSATSTSELIRA